MSPAELGATHKEWSTETQTDIWQRRAPYVTACLYSFHSGPTVWYFTSAKFESVLIICFFLFLSSHCLLFSTWLWAWRLRLFTRWWRRCCWWRGWWWECPGQFFITKSARCLKTLKGLFLASMLSKLVSYKKTYICSSNSNYSNLNKAELVHFSEHWKKSAVN